MSGRPSITLTMRIRSSPSIRLSASKMIMYLYRLPQRRQKSLTLPLFLWMRTLRRR